MIFMHSVSTKCFYHYYAEKVFCFWGQSTENYIKMVMLRYMWHIACMLHACERSVCLNVVQSVHVCDGEMKGWTSPVCPSFSTCKSSPDFLKHAY